VNGAGKEGDAGEDIETKRVHDTFMWCCLIINCDFMPGDFNVLSSGHEAEHGHMYTAGSGGNYYITHGDSPDDTLSCFPGLTVTFGPSFIAF
jgi:hypothetical protein